MITEKKKLRAGKKDKNEKERERERERDRSCRKRAAWREIGEGEDWVTLG